MTERIIRKGAVVGKCDEWWQLPVNYHITCDGKSWVIREQDIEDLIAVLKELGEYGLESEDCN